MRYQNWDVLIFPERSKVPLQEFKTQCLVTQDHGRCSIIATQQMTASNMRQSTSRAPSLPTLGLLLIIRTMASRYCFYLLSPALLVV
jgi:hypothetical protein